MSVLDYEDDSFAGYVIIDTGAISLFGLTAIGFLISALRFKISTPPRTNAAAYELAR